jgi:hypothetical protein
MTSYIIYYQQVYNGIFIFLKIDFLEFYYNYCVAFYSS